MNKTQMGKAAIITCFGYPDNEKYIFNPDYLRADLRRLISFAMNKMNVTGNKLYVITDMPPNKTVMQNIILEYQQTAIQKFKELGFIQKIKKSKRRQPLNWLKVRCQQILPGDPGIKLFDKIRKLVIPNVRTSNIVEFAAVFTQFSLVDGRKHYIQLLKHIRSKIDPTDNVLVYYTGHGVRITNNRKLVSLALVIQKEIGTAEFLDHQELSKLIGIYDNSLIIYDCCHSSGLIDPSGINSVFLASTSDQQTCGFYDNNETKEYGSLFTFFLLRNLNQGITDIHQLFQNITREVTKYREKTSKKSQDMNIKISDNTNREINNLNFIFNTE